MDVMGFRSGATFVAMRCIRQLDSSDLAFGMQQRRDVYQPCRHTFEHKNTCVKCNQLVRKEPSTVHRHLRKHPHRASAESRGASLTCGSQFRSFRTYSGMGESSRLGVARVRREAVCILPASQNGKFQWALQSWRVPEGDWRQEKRV